MASFGGAHVSLEGRARFEIYLTLEREEMATGSANPGQIGEQMLMRLLQAQQEQMGQLQRLLEQGQRP